jgi:hypothetical protein
MMETMLPATARRDGFLFDMFVSAPAINSGIPFGDVSAPTLVVTAADDALASPANARRLASLIPDARLLEVDTGGHLLLGQSESVSAGIRAFIEQVSAVIPATVITTETTLRSSGCERIGATGTHSHGAGVGHDVDTVAAAGGTSVGHEWDMRPDKARIVSVRRR